MHDLEGRTITSLDFINGEHLKQRFKYVQKLREGLRGRFQKEYLNLLVHTGKRIKEIRPVKVGEIVLVGQDNLKRFDWPLGKVEKLIEGRDGHSRVAEVKMKTGTVVRPIQRLYPLEISSEEAKDVMNCCINLEL